MKKKESRPTSSYC